MQSSSIKDRVAALIALVERGEFLSAIESFYAPDASMQENGDTPRQGLANLLEHERAALRSFKEIHVIRAESHVIDGDRAAINWVFEYTDTSGRRHRLDEVAYQHWSGGKIVRERFYYDPGRRAANSTVSGGL